MVANLVTQFADPFDALRELAQNSIDAGTSRVEFWLDFLPSDGPLGTIELHVDDFGEGMDETIIDNQFTRLFASTKENDLTKIGKFGIGFVSVFALKPKAVLVHTGRAGEYWEVLFDEHLNISKTRLDSPLEGTQITIFLEGDRRRYDDVVKRARASLKKWCVYSESEITFEDRHPASGFPALETITESFAESGPFTIHRSLPGTEVVLSITDEPNYSFFNRGLTLATTDSATNVFEPRVAEKFSGIRVKMKSRYLEHTLSRDTIVRDENYEKAVAILLETRSLLIDHVISQIESRITKPEWSFDDLQTYSGFLDVLLSLSDLNEIPKITSKPIFMTLDKKPVSTKSLFEMYRKTGRILISPEPDTLTAQVGNHRVILGALQPGQMLSVVSTLIPKLFLRVVDESLLETIRYTFFGMDLGKILTDPHHVFMPVKVVEMDPETHRFISQTLEVLHEVAQLRYREVVGFHPMADESPFFLFADQFGGQMARPPAFSMVEKREIGINLLHPHFQKVRRLWPDHPEIAIFSLARFLLLDADRMLTTDEAMAIAAAKFKKGTL